MCRAHRSIGLATKTVAIVTFERFNEIDSLLALHIIGRVAVHGLRASIVAPTEAVTSMNGVRITSAQPLESIASADVVLFGSGKGTREAIADRSVMQRIAVDPSRQLIGSQCSGALVLQHLALIGDQPVCTDAVTRQDFEQRGVRVLDRALTVTGSVAMAGGCFAAQYLAAWVITETLGWERACEAIAYVAPVGEEHATISRVRHALDGARR